MKSRLLSACSSAVPTAIVAAPGLAPVWNVVWNVVRSFFRCPDRVGGSSSADGRSPVDRPRPSPRTGHSVPPSLPGHSTRDIVCDDGVHLRVEYASRPGSALTVVFVHGIGSGLQEFDEQRTGLSEYASMVSYDLRGHGGSDIGPPGEVTLPRLAQDLATVIEATTDPGQRIVLVAHSLGGMITLSLIDAHPELVGTRVVAVALMSTAVERIAQVATPDAVGLALVKTHAAHGLLRVAAWCAPAIDALKPALSLPGRWWLRYTMFGRDRPAPGLLSAKQRLWAHTPAAVIASTYRSLMDFDRAPALATLGRIPVLLVTGTNDRTIPAQRSKNLATRVGTTAELLTIDGAGHSVNQTHAREVNDAIRDLIRRAQP